MRQWHPKAYVKKKNKKLKLKIFQKLLSQIFPKKDSRASEFQKRCVCELKTPEIYSILYMEQNEGSFV